MLFLPATVHESDGFVHENTEREFWFWDGASGRFMERPIIKTTTPSAANKLVETAVPRCFLSNDGSHLFWFENRKKTLMTQDLRQEMSVNRTFRTWQTDLSGQQVQEIASQSFPSCKCETAVCSETCPEASYWPPDDGVGDFFVMTEWIPGQIGSEYQGSSLYRKAEGKWVSGKLPAIEKVLDSSFHGSDVALLEAIGDSGCCGWENESSDQTLLLKNAKTVALFDEFKQYHEPGLRHQLLHFQRLPVAQWRPRGLHHQRYATVGNRNSPVGLGQNQPRRTGADPEGAYRITRSGSGARGRSREAGY